MKLTPSQAVILAYARAWGGVTFGLPDRKGTRFIGSTDIKGTGYLPHSIGDHPCHKGHVAILVSYGYPEHQLVAHGMLTKALTSKGTIYFPTDKGLDEIGTLSIADANKRLPRTRAKP